MLLFLSCIAALVFTSFADCDQPLFSKSNVSSSSSLSADFCAGHAQLNSLNAWCPQQNFTQNEFIQLVFPTPQLISRIKIAGEGSPGVNMTARRVTKYRLMISKDGENFQFLKKVGADDFSLSVIVHGVRLVPVDSEVFPCMRLEVFGCDPPSPELCSNQNGGCSQRCIQHSKYCIWGKCFLSCLNDWMCTKFVECDCNKGYKLNEDKKTCSDINECQVYNGGCDHNCTNSIGSYDCSCRKGFLLGADRHTCNDVDECLDDNGGCEQICHNRAGSYECECRVGFTMNADKHNCTDINECLVNNGGCSHGCVNLVGRYYCSCPKGFEVGASGKTCVDKNECLLANGGCEHYCENTNGSYHCFCRPGGYELYDTYKCRDIDECSRSTDKCDDASTTCHNYEGDYECRCRKGYKHIPNTRFKCERISCPALAQATGTTITPPECMQGNGRKVGDKCTTTCQTGYELGQQSPYTMTCLDTGLWDIPPVSCKPVRCPILSAPANGDVSPSFCKTSGNTFGQMCYYTCNPGYQTPDNTKRQCLRTGKWDISATPTCTKIYVKPWINCPLDVIVVLGDTSNTADVTSKLQKPTSNMKNVRMTPDKYNGNLLFPAGQTTLTYTATNGNGETAQCTTDIIVEDRTAPLVVYCPADIEKTITGSSTTVTWKAPEFKDNVNVTKETTTHSPGSQFSLGLTRVYYAAVDAAGNRAHCEFKVNVKAKQCPNPVQPDNGKLNCQIFGVTHWCTIACNPGTQTFLYTFGTSCSSAATATWQPIPDCVDAVTEPASGVCPDGKIKQKSLSGYPNYIKYCVACPRGYKYEAKDCVKCPVGYTSAGSSSTSCTKCGPGTSNKQPGSKNCYDLCKAGKWSSDGFDKPLNTVGCAPCSKGYYSDVYGAKSCTQCPNGRGSQDGSGMRRR
ncbi:signal peptide, CUB and EGF-like domain-containing protein 2 [Nematostella vectensis]|uniref:signal peptide, CUB and EGF-like domain-containing protein 2 n=1 Tax=Nematostella vectensis TaxID=45351 RepID=UPI0020776AF1|nr:signal peptide, CUB and EGF-like domain-containing protein 2 [Nematostella vectensis]